MLRTIKSVFSAFIVSAIITAVVAAFGITVLVVPGAPYLVASLLVLGLIVIASSLFASGCKEEREKCRPCISDCVKLVSAILLIAVVLALVILSGTLTVLVIPILGLFVLLFAVLTLLFTIISDSCR